MLYFPAILVDEVLEITELRLGKAGRKGASIRFLLTYLVVERTKTIAVVSRRIIEANARAEQSASIRSLALRKPRTNTWLGWSRYSARCAGCCAGTGRCG